MANQPTANPFALDSEIAALCDAAAAWLAAAMAPCAPALAFMHAAKARAFQATCRATTSSLRLHTGYRPAAERRAFRHGLYSSGTRTPKPRPTVADRVAAEAVRWGHCS